MPLIVCGKGNRVPPRWAQRHSSSPTSSDCRIEGMAEALQIGLINSMPDPALEDTEMQFFELIDAASANLPVCITLYFLPEVPRIGKAELHITDHYSDFRALLQSRLDGIIITGTEPRQRNLRDEAYWRSLTTVFDWAESNTTSAILSCLAAHASVLYSDGVDRTPLSDKQFGVFRYDNCATHALTNGVGNSLRFPHSRWNELLEPALEAQGYSVLGKSSDAGVNIFVKQKKNSLFVYLQGHPEYFTHTLLKEYRRDIRRFLARERETYPSMPQGYFGESANRQLNDFRECAEACRRESLIDLFPENSLAASLQNTWQPSAVTLYRNWLHYLLSHRALHSDVSSAISALRY